MLDLLIYMLFVNQMAETLRFDNIYLADAQKEKLVFSWNSLGNVSNNCSALKYNITFDCGTCTITNMSIVTCSDLQLTSNAVVCNFSVNSVVCNQAGDPTSPVSVTLKGNKQ